MKKTLLSALLLITVALSANAQVTFKPGVRAGVNFSHFTKGDYYNNNIYYAYDTNPYSPQSNQRPASYDYGTKTDFYVGVYGALRFTRFYTLQPEIDYSRQGAKLDFRDPKVPFQSTSNVDVSYLALTLISKFTFNNFNVHFGPTLDFVVDKSRIDSYEYNQYGYLPRIDNDIDLGVQVGAGYNFTNNFGIEARVKKGFIPVVSADDNRTSVNFSIGATYTFDLKAAK